MKQPSAADNEKQPGNVGFAAHPVSAQSTYSAYVPGEEDEVDLFELVMVLIRGWKWIVSVVILVTLIGGLILFLLPNQYRAGAILRFSQETGTGESIGDAKDYVPLFLVDASLIMAFQKAGITEGADDHYTIEEINHIVHVISPKNTQLLEVSAIFHNPQKAKKIVDAVVAEGLSEVERVFNQQSDHLLKQAQKHFEETRQALRKGEKEYLTLAKESGIEEKKTEFEILQEESKSLQRDIVVYQGRIQELEATLKASKATLKTIEPKKVYIKSLAESPEVLAALSKSGVSPSSFLGADLKEEVPNPSYEDIETSIPPKEILLASLKSLYADKEKMLTTVQKEVETLLPQVVESQYRLDQAKVELELARKMYNQANEKLWQIKGGQAIRIQPFSVINPAHEPSIKYGPARKPILIGIVSVALFLTCIGLLLKNAYDRRLQSNITRD